MALKDARTAYPGPEFGRRYYIGGREVTAVKWREYNRLGAPARQVEYRRLQGSRSILPSYEGCGRAVAATFKTGGGTFEKRTLKPVSAATGYQVGLTVPVAAGTVLESTPAGAIAEYVRSYAHAAAEYIKKDEYLGTWIDEDLFYIEISRHIEEYAEAVAVARRHGQREIWQWDKSLSLPVAPAGEESI